MYENIRFSIGSTESTVNIEKIIQEYFFSKRFCFKGAMIFPKPAWDCRMSIPILLGNIKTIFWPFVVCFRRFTLDFFYKEVKQHVLSLHKQLL